MLPLLILLLPLCADSVPQIASDAQGRVGAAAAVIEGNHLLAFHAHEHFPMQSVYKLPIGMAVLAQIDQSRLRLDQVVHVNKGEYISKGQKSPLRDANPNGADVPVSELLRLAVLESDGTASDVLLRLIGGPSAAMKFLLGLGVKDITIRDTEMRLGQDHAVQYENWATPDGAIGLLRAVEESRGLSPASHALLMKLLTETRTSPNRIKGLLPPGTMVAHKTGSSGTRDGIAAATNDIGIVTLPDGRHLAIAVFVSDSKADDQTRDRVIARIARQAWDLAIQK
jgi:beta-lactamase class A